MGANSAADAAIPDCGRRARAGGCGSGGLRAQSDPDDIGLARRPGSAPPGRSDGVLRRTLCAAQGVVLGTQTPLWRFRPREQAAVAPDLVVLGGARNSPAAPHRRSEPTLSR